jgi:hypothetical protein
MASSNGHAPHPLIPDAGTLADTNSSVRKARGSSSGTPGIGMPVAPSSGSKFSEIGAPGVYMAAGLVMDEFLPALMGDKAIRVYREMGDNDPTAGAVLYAIKMLIRQVEWGVEPYEDEAKERKMAEARTAQAQAEKKDRAAALLNVAAKAPPASGTKPGVAPELAKIAKFAPPSGSAVHTAPAATATPTTSPGQPPADTQQDPNNPPDISPPHDAEAEANAEFVESCFHDMDQTWEDILSQIMTFPQYGWSWHETIYKMRRGPQPDGKKLASSKHDDGKIGWRDIAGRAQETRFRWDWDTERQKLRGMYQLIPGEAGTRYMPLAKCLLFRTQADKGNPEGRSCLRNAYRPWYFKSRIEDIEAIGIERDLAGLPVVWVPLRLLAADASMEEKAALHEFKNLVTNIKRNEQEGVIMPLVLDESGNKLYDLQLLNSGGQREFDTDKIIMRYNLAIMMSMLADFLSLGHDKVGTQALGSSKIDLFTSALEAWVDMIADQFNSHAIPRLLRINGMNEAKSPKLTFRQIAATDLAALSQFILALSQAGMPMFPDEALEEQMRNLANMPPKSVSGDEAVAAAATQQAPGAPPTGQKGPDGVLHGSQGPPTTKVPPKSPSAGAARPARPAPAGGGGGTAGRAPASSRPRTSA